MVKQRQKESVVLCMADLHYGKQTRSFNREVFPDKLTRIKERLNRVHQLMSSSYEFDELVIAALGDWNDGTCIYPTQAFHQDIGNVEQQAEELAELLGPWFLDLKKVWGNVRLECVPGNHGRAGRFAHENASWDVVAYRYLKNGLKGHIPVNINRRNEDVFMRKMKVKGHNYLLYHGHDIPMYQSVPWYGLRIRVSRWNTTRLHPFAAVLMGHFHYLGFDGFNQIDIYLNGTPVTDDDWALRKFGYESSNQWWMFGVSNKRPVTWDFKLDVD